MHDSIRFSRFADLHWREGDWSGCEARLGADSFERIASGAETDNLAGWSG